MKKYIIIIVSLVIVLGGFSGWYLYNEKQKENKLNEVYNSIALPDTSNYNEDELVQYNAIIDEMKEAKQLKNIEKLENIQSKLDLIQSKYNKRLEDEKTRAEEEQAQQKKKDEERKQQEEQKESDRLKEKEYWHEWCKNTPDSNPEKINHCV